jgi:hypothetical protein
MKKRKLELKNKSMNQKRLLFILVGLLKEMMFFWIFNQGPILGVNFFIASAPDDLILMNFTSCSVDARRHAAELAIAPENNKKSH